MAPSSQCGIFRDDVGPPLPLPLEGVHVNVEIVDVSAKVIVSQDFRNDCTDNFHATYVFPVPARAAVCGFEMRTEDGQIIQGIAKERREAEKDYKQAKEDGKATGLVKRATDDIFALSLGCIPKEQKVSIRLVYTFDLSKSEQDEIRFYLPEYVGKRYGKVPRELEEVKSATDSKVVITTFIQMPGVVSVTCPTHTISNLSTNHGGSALSNCATVKFRSDTFLTQDFVLIIKAHGLDESRCFVEKKPGSLAMQLAFVPKDFKLPVIPSQEYIVLIDRSGSMEGDRIDKAKEALVMLLRQLPSHGTTFNIVSFGNNPKKMNERSLDYNQGSLDSATQHVKSMSANMGGTELEKALQSIFRSRSKVCPTSVIVLTDGETFDIDKTLGLVYKEVRQAPLDAPLRIFTLGIGGTTSSAMCEGLARVGNGVCVMTTKAENIVASCSRIVKASTSQSLQRVEVDWRVETPSSTSVFQSPLPVKSIYPGYRCIITALIEGEDLQVPHEVVVRVSETATTSYREIRVPVHPVETQNERTALIHTQAARQYIREREDEDLVQGGFDEKRNIEEIVRLGKRYQLASRHTSFVAVGEAQATNGTIQSSASSVSPKQIAGEGVSGAKGSPETFIPHQTDKSHTPPSLSPRGRAPHIVALAPAHPNSHYNDSDDDDCDLQPRGRSNQFKVQNSRPEKLKTSGSSQTVSTVFQVSNTEDSCKSSLLEPVDQEAIQVDSPHVPRGRTTYSLVETSSAVSHTASCTPSSFPDTVTHSTQIVSPTTIPIRTESDIYELVKLQRFDGSFSPTPRFVEIMGSVAIKRAQDSRYDEIVWATALAVAFLKKYASNRPEFLENLLEKSLEFLQGNPHAQHIGIQYLLDRAMNEV